MVPIVKKRKRVKVKKSRGITLTQTAYKMYDAERLREEVESKVILPLSQAGFTKGMATIDCVNVLNSLINKKVAKEKGKIAVMFVDMRTAFDLVDRGIQLECIKKKRVREGLVVRCEEMLKETVSRVRVEKREKRRFWLGKGVIQECFLNLCFFTLLLVDLDKVLEEKSWGGVKVGRKKIISLVYADDVAVVAEDKGGFKGMIKRLEKICGWEEFSGKCRKNESNKV